jgi:superfamily I DNA/RNA helicase
MLNLKNLNAENVTKVFLQYQHKRAYRILKGIYIITMHQSKGREFDIVYVIREPNMKAQDNLFYVAVTRTKGRLVLFEQKYI